MAELVWRGKALPRPSGVEVVVEGFYGLVDGEVMGAGAPGDWYNRLLHGERGLALQALQSEFAGKVDLIYIDPPFMTGRTFKNGAQILTGDGISYHDIWNNDLDSYLQWLYETFYYLYELLAKDGSLYVHLDWRATHYARVILDEVFAGRSRSKGAGLKNEIIWHYQSGGRAQKSFARKHDTILLYTKTAEYCFHSERIGQPRGEKKRNHMRKEVGPDGHTIWTIRSAGKLYTYRADSTMSLDDVWSDISHLHQKDPERTGYATQKPVALLERILLASTEENDLVLDCFCGSGVTPVAAERLGRRWLACDQNKGAIAVTRQRLLQETRRNVFALQSVNRIE
ncbi:site-specific DNA-methyltransferase [Dictyobacter alpinus]|uniref:Site-specific DNA-methyltransferase n=2 Tax=Dictyobacter alpinus TaxID=2014873 RepID=A0A402BBG8_9CHLR|nr:site-specific DNA-methyltransferase [Dictyobacter alpinus]